MLSTANNDDVAGAGLLAVWNRGSHFQFGLILLVWVLTV